MRVSTPFGLKKLSKDIYLKVRFFYCDPLAGFRIENLKVPLDWRWWAAWTDAWRVCTGFQVRCGCGVGMHIGTLSLSGGPLLGVSDAAVVP